MHWRDYVSKYNAGEITSSELTSFLCRQVVSYPDSETEVIQELNSRAETHVDFVDIVVRLNTLVQQTRDAMRRSG